MDLQDKKNKIYDILMNLENGDYNDRSFAFDWIGYLSNESINDSLEKRLDIIEEKIIEYNKSKEKIK